MYDSVPNKYDLAMSSSKKVGPYQNPLFLDSFYGTNRESTLGGASNNWWA